MGCLLGGFLQRRHWIVSVSSILLIEIGFLCAGCYNGRNWIATVWMVRVDRIEWGWDGGGMEGPTLAGAEGAPPFSLEVRRATGIGRWRQEAVYYTN